MKKQLKIWKDDFLRYWDKTNLVVRILIGAGISLVLTLVVIQKVNKPLSDEVKKLKSKISTNVISTIENDPEIIDSEIKLKSAQKKLKTWQEKAEEQKKTSLMKKANLSTAINKIRTMLTLNNLQLKEEAYHDHTPGSKKTTQSRRRRKSYLPTSKKPSLREKLNIPSAIDIRVYKYTVIGSYINTCRFLWAVRELTFSLELTNINMTRKRSMSNTIHTVKNKKVTKLIITFDLVLLYEAAPKANKKKQKTIAKK